MFTSVAEAGDFMRATELGVTRFCEKFPAQHMIEEIVAEIAKSSAPRRSK